MKMTVAVGMTLAVLTGCNSYESGNVSTFKTNSKVVEPKTYSVTLSTLNSSESNKAMGKGTFKIGADTMMADIEMESVTADSRYTQMIYAGSRCPVGTDDTTQDGSIDESEALIVMGQEVLSLDDNLMNSAEGETIYPTGDASGNYNYSQSVPVADLNGVDLNLVGKVLLISRVSETETLPVACGVIGGGTQTSTPGQTQTQTQIQQIQQVQQTQASQHAQGQQDTQVEVQDEEATDEVVVIEETAE